MKKGIVILTVFLLLLTPLVFAQELNIFQKVWYKITGRAVEGPPENAGQIPQFGPSTEEISCMKKCVTDAGCTIGDEACSTKNNCMAKCNIVKPEQTAEETCVETCALVGCDKFDFECQKANQAKCDKECGMIKEPEAKSPEEQCIRDCVNAEAPGTICEASQTGETGNELCQRCAKSCENLYEGPCLNEEKLEAKKKECQTCEHCYAKTIMGPSGEGWDCIVGVECADASSEFGDEPGTGPGIAKTMSNADYSWSVNCTDVVNYTNKSNTWNLTVSYTAPAVEETGGGGGGGGSTVSFWTKTEVINEEQFVEGFSKELSVKNRIKLDINESVHYIGIINFSEYSETATINISSNPIQIILGIGKDKKIEITNDSFYDIYIKLNSIISGKANLTIKGIYEKIPEEELNITYNKEENIAEEENMTNENNSEKDIKSNGEKYWIISVMGLVLLIAIIGFAYWKIKRGENKKRRK